MHCPVIRKSGKKRNQNLSQGWQLLANIVMPAKAGIRKTRNRLDSGLRRNDDNFYQSRIF
jgi:hypothetical protein